MFVKSAKLALGGLVCLCLIFALCFPDHYEVFVSIAIGALGVAGAALYYHHRQQRKAEIVKAPQPLLAGGLLSTEEFSSSDF